MEKEFQFYLDNQDVLVEKYNGRFIVIIGEEVIGDYETNSDALTEAQKNHEPGTFLIQYCAPGTDTVSQTFRSRAIFQKV